MRDFFTSERQLPGPGPLLHCSSSIRIPRRDRQVLSQSRREYDICFWWSSPPWKATRDGVRRPALSRDSTFLERMDREIKVQRPMAGDGQSLCPDVEAADQPRAWLADCSANLF